MSTVESNEMVESAENAGEGAGVHDDAVQDGSEMRPEDLMSQIRGLRRENARYRTERNQLREAAEKWAEHEDSQKSELQRLQESHSELERQLAEQVAKSDRLEIAAEFNVPAAQVKLLTGGSREELVEQAEAIMELVQSVESRPPSRRSVEGLAPGAVKRSEVPDEYPAAWRPKGLRD